MKFIWRIHNFSVSITQSTCEGTQCHGESHYESPLHVKLTQIHCTYNHTYCQRHIKVILIEQRLIVMSQKFIVRDHKIILGVRINHCQCHTVIWRSHKFIVNITGVIVGNIQSHCEVIQCRCEGMQWELQRVFGKATESIWVDKITFWGSVRVIVMVTQSHWECTKNHCVPDNKSFWNQA